jgi:hypothetical protein
MIHTTPKAAIKQSAPPTAAPIIMLKFVLTDSLPELELKLFALIVLDAVTSGAVSTRDHEYRGENLHGKTQKLYSGALKSVWLESLYLCGSVVLYDSLLHDRKNHSKICANSHYL